MSLGRTFPEETIDHGGERVRAMVITCAECGAVAYFPAMQTGPRRPPSMARKSFQNKGWVVGSGPRKDFCPHHAAPAARKGRSSMPAASSKADAPRTMTREERGIIFAKIGDVYSGERYVTPWTDQKVADDLNVPRAWVSEVRDAFYGPEGSNPLFDQYLAAAAGIERIRGEIAEERKRLLELAAGLRGRCDDLDSKIRDQAVLGKRIEREIGR